MAAPQSVTIAIISATTIFMSEWPPLIASCTNFAASATPVLWPTLMPGSVRLTKTSDPLPPGTEEVSLYPGSVSSHLQLLNPCTYRHYLLVLWFCAKSEHSDPWH
ncbi:hypothetical protein PoB_004385500 [Plakobranchus ocellatus]|uniref:Secreted protein n=1 Tax=Plakobranchus ocellatus TaxID=259542 RepID=A0AAV4B9S9_9GAST|nr:hypothetical protein PoB_004385500 [Plakobranchus ocellatus]